MTRGRWNAISHTLLDHVDRSGIGGAVSLVWRDGEVQHREAVGHLDAGARVPMGVDALFRIASMTKPIVSCAALMLIEEGRFSLDDAINRWIPEFSDMTVLIRPDGDLHEVEPARRPITIRDLLTHRAGLGYDISCEGPLSSQLEQMETALDTGMSPDEWLRRLGNMPLACQPGARWLYGFSTDVLGLLISRVEGVDLASCLRKRVLDPLGMTDTTFVLPAGELRRFPVAYSYRKDGTRQIADDPARSLWTDGERIASGGGGLISTADDYLRFARMLLEEGKVGSDRLLTAKSVALLTGNHMTRTDRTREVFGCRFFAGQRFGLGVATTDDVARREQTVGYASLGSFCWSGVFATTFLVDPIERMIVILLTQTRRTGLTIQLTREVLNHCYLAL